MLLSFLQLGLFLCSCSLWFILKELRSFLWSHFLSLNWNISWSFQIRDLNAREICAPCSRCEKTGPVVRIIWTQSTGHNSCEFTRYAKYDLSHSAVCKYDTWKQLPFFLMERPKCSCVNTHVLPNLWGHQDPSRCELPSSCSFLILYSEAHEFFWRTDPAQTKNVLQDLITFLHPGHYHHVHVAALCQINLSFPHGDKFPSLAACLTFCCQLTSNSNQCNTREACPASHSGMHETQVYSSLWCWVILSPG